MIVRVSIVLFALGLVTVTGAGVGPIRNATTARVASIEPAASGLGTLTCLPSEERGQVIDIYRVTSDVQENVTVTRIGLVNLSRRHVTRVKLGWRLFGENQREPLIRGESPVLSMPLNTGKRLLVTYPLVSFSSISEWPTQRGQINGSFRVEVSAEEIIFEDGSQQMVNRTASRGRAVRVGYKSRHGWYGLVAQQCEECVSIEEDPNDGGDESGGGGACANKACAFILVTKKFTCVDANGYTCSLGKGATSCTNKACR